MRILRRLRGRRQQVFCLRRINMTSAGNSSPSWSVGRGKSTLLSIIGMLDSAWMANIIFSTSRCTTECEEAQRIAQSKSVSSSELPLDRQPYCLRKSGNSAVLQKCPTQRACEPGLRHLDRFNIVGKKIVPEPTIRRAAATCWSSARRDSESKLIPPTTQRNLHPRGDEIAALQALMRRPHVFNHHSSATTTVTAYPLKDRWVVAKEGPRHRISKSGCDCGTPDAFHRLRRED